MISVPPLRLFPLLFPIKTPLCPLGSRLMPAKKNFPASFVVLLSVSATSRIWCASAQIGYGARWRFLGARVRRSARSVSFFFFPSWWTRDAVAVERASGRVNVRAIAGAVPGIMWVRAGVLANASENEGGWQGPPGLKWICRLGSGLIACHWRSCFRRWCRQTAICPVISYGLDSWRVDRLGGDEYRDDGRERPAWIPGP